MEMLNNIQIKNLLEIHNFYKEPLYLFDMEQLIRNFLSLETAFNRIYHNTKIAYSYKTNPVSYICSLISSLGGFSEVVSPAEFYHAKNNVKVQISNIIYNGVYRDDYGKAAHIKNGCIVNVNSLCEFERLSLMLRDSKCKIGIRIMTNPHTRFGMSEQEINTAITIANKNNIEINGIHCHDGFDRSATSWHTKIPMIFDIADNISKSFKLDYIDIGGHFFSNMDDRLKEQFDCHIPDFQEYATIIAKSFINKYGENGPILILEPGTALVANTISVLASVVDVKTRHPQKIVTVDVCCYDLGIMNKNRPVDIVQCERSIENKCLIAGYTCIENDIIHRDYRHDLNVGDILLFRDCGAYSNAMKPQFIMPPLSMLRVNSDFEPEAIIKSRKSIF